MASLAGVVTRASGLPSVGARGGAAGNHAPALRASASHARSRQRHLPLSGASSSGRDDAVASGVFATPRGFRRRRGERQLCRCAAGEGPSSRRVGSSNPKPAPVDPISGALHATSRLRQRLAEVSGSLIGTNPPDSSGSDAKAGGQLNEDWERWQREFDRVDSQEGVLAALEVSVTSGKA